jgi:hypothetical protein
VHRRTEIVVAEWERYLKLFTSDSFETTDERRRARPTEGETQQQW